MEIVNNCSYGVITQRQISGTGRESKTVDNLRVSVDHRDEGVYENVEYNFTNIPIEQNHAYNVHSTGRLDEVSEYVELIIPTESAANVIVQQNQAYNIITTQPTTDRCYENIPENANEQIYEEQQNHLTQAPGEVSTQAPKKVSTPISPLKAICRTWQGKVEVAVRINILVLAFLLMGLYVSAGQAYITPNEFSLNPLNSYIRVIVGGIFPLQLSIVISMEIVHLCIRTCRIRTTKCFLTWDILYCCMISFFSLVFLGISTWQTVLWSTTSNLVEYVLFILTTVLCFIFTALYMLRVCWIRATISMKWDSRMEI